MNQLLSQKDLSLSDVSKYGLFFRNIFIANIVEKVEQKKIEIQNLHNLSQKINLQSNQINESEVQERSLMELKELLLNLNYSDLEVQIDIALAQIEIIESISNKQEDISNQDQQLPNSECIPQYFYLNQNELGNSQAPKEEVNTDHINNPPFLPKSTHSFCQNCFKDNKSEENIQEFPLDEELTQIKKEADLWQILDFVELIQFEISIFCSFIEINEENIEVNDEINQQQLKYKIFKDGMNQIKEFKYRSYMNKLIKFESFNGILITPYFKDKKNFFNRFENKGVAILSKLSTEDKSLIYNIHLIVGKQSAVAELLELPNRLVSRVLSDQTKKNAQ